MTKKVSSLLFLRVFSLVERIKHQNPIEQQRGTEVFREINLCWTRKAPTREVLFFGETKSISERAHDIEIERSKRVSFERERERVVVEDVVGASKAKKRNVADDENRAFHFNKCGASLLYKNEQEEIVSQYRSEIAIEQ